jgi:hypothetical protein
MDWTQTVGIVLLYADFAWWYLLTVHEEFPVCLGLWFLILHVEICHSAE